MEKWVFHEKYGKGIVLKTRYLGFEQFIQFSNGIEKWIKSYKLKSIENSTQTNTGDIIGDKADIYGPNVPHYPRSQKPVISFEKPIETKNEEYSDISIPNVPLFPRSHKPIISFDKPIKTKSEEYSDISIPNVPLYPRSHKPIISFDEPVKTENTEQKNIVSATEIPDITHHLESEIHFDEPVKTENTEQKNIVSATEIPDITHSLESEIHFDEPPKTENTEQKNIVSVTEIPDITHSLESKIRFDEPPKTENTEQKNIVSVTDIPDITHPLESEIHLDEPFKNENTENKNVVIGTNIHNLGHECDESIKFRGNVSSRMIIEALRLGGVSHNQVGLFTYGREKEINYVNEWLASKKGSMLINGDYGVGKTHLLEIISLKAIEKGWAVARIEIDPDEAPLNKPKKIYQHFVNSFSYRQNGRDLGFQDFIESIAESKKSSQIRKLINHPYLGKILIHWKDEEDKSWLLDWIKGDGSKPADFPQMPDTQTAANVYCNILSGLGWSAKNILGLRGIIILFDEAECVDPSWYNHNQFVKALRFLKAIILMSNNDEKLLEDCTFSSTSRELGLEYFGGSRIKYPFLWEHESCIKLIFSFVPEMLECMKTDTKLYSLINKIPEINIDTLEDQDLQHLLEEVILVYKDAYDFTIKDDIFPYISRNKTRKFVKGAIECLDIMRFNPEMHPSELIEFSK